MYCIDTEALVFMFNEGALTALLFIRFSPRFAGYIFIISISINLLQHLNRSGTCMPGRKAYHFLYYVIITKEFLLYTVVTMQIIIKKFLLIDLFYMRITESSVRLV